MKNSEILELSNEGLVERLNQEKANLHKLKFAHAVSSIENPLRIRASRRLVARLNTEITARKNAEARKEQETAAEAQ